MVYRNQGTRARQVAQLGQLDIWGRQWQRTVVVEEVQFYFWEIYGRGGGKLLPVGGKRARVLFVDLRLSCRVGGPKLHIFEGI